jgi:hypothetical protein
MRIYLVQQLGAAPRLIEATNKVAAANYVARSTITAEIATPADLVRMLPGTKIETAREPAPEAA